MIVANSPSQNHRIKQKKTFTNKYKGEAMLYVANNNIAT